MTSTSIISGINKESGFAKVAIKDTGIGIPKKESEHIFERFYQVDRSRGKESGGVGLGLSICQWIVKAHQGTIELESKVGKGSCFIVTLPLLAGDEHAWNNLVARETLITSLAHAVSGVSLPYLDALVEHNRH